MRNLWRYLMIVSFPLVVCLPLRAEQAPPAAKEREKAAWEWTVAERSKVRFDLRAAERRISQQRDREGSEDAAEQSGGAPNSEISLTETLEGSRYPELIFPNELFSYLLHLGFETEGEARQEARRRIQQGATALGIGEDFWARLKVAVTPALEINVQSRQDPPKGAASRSKLKYGLDEADIRECRIRGKALNAAKSEFGEEEFLRLLYDAVAPTYYVSYFVHEKAGETYSYIEKGCP